VLDAVYTGVYTFFMAEHAKIFQNGGSQAVRLPKSCRFPDDQQSVLVHRVGRRVILEPAEQWTRKFLEALGAWKQKIERPRARGISKMRDPFE
jgi:antitoxin VapB